MSNTLAVVSQSGESISFFDLTSGTKTITLRNLIPEPHELCFDDRTNLLYVTHAYDHGWYVSHGDDGHQISAVDCKDGRRMVVEVIDTSPGKGPHFAVLDVPRDILYACVEGGLRDGERESGGIIGIDLGTRKVVKTIASGWKSHWFVLTPDGRKAYTCNKEAEFVSVIDLVQEKMVGRIEMPGGCEQPSISPDGRFAYFPSPTIAVGMTRTSSDFSVQVIDTACDSTVRSIPLDLGALTTHVDATGRLLVAQYRFAPRNESSTGPPMPLNGRLVVYPSEADGHQELGSVEVGKATLTLCSTADGTKVFAANQWSGTVTVIDTDAIRVERTLEVDTVKPAGKDMLNGAHGMAVVP